MSPPAVNRVPALDGVRGIAVLLVLLWHYLPCQLATDTDLGLSYLAKALSLTWSGVDLFFVLSGFLITGILLDHRDAPHYFRTFYVRRVCRIFPLYFLLLGAFLLHAWIPVAEPAARWLFADPMPAWSYATFTQNVFMGLRGDYGPHWLAVTWSLAVEEQFYLVVPLLVWLLPRHRLVAVLALLVLAAPLLRVAVPGFFGFVNALWRADSLLTGGLLAIAVRSSVALALVQRHQRALLTLFVILLGGAAALTDQPDAFGALASLWLAALYGTFVLLAFAFPHGPVATPLRISPLIWLGQRSYGIYLLHQAVSGLLHGTLRGAAPAIATAADFAVTLTAVAITLLLAECSWRWLEAPIVRIGQRYQYA